MRLSFILFLIQTMALSAFIQQPIVDALNPLTTAAALASLLSAPIVAAFNLDVQSVVVKTPGDRWKGSYFGFSVAFSNNTDQVYVGAPRARTGGRALGIIFRCPIVFGSSSMDCESMGSSLLLQDEEEWQDGQWLGVSIASVGEREDEQVIACAHRFWTAESRGHRNPVGKCLQFEPRIEDPRVIRINPCSSGNDHNFKGVCQAGVGLSVSPPTRETDFRDLDFTLGTPGFCDFSGGVVHRRGGVLPGAKVCKETKPTTAPFAYLGHAVLHLDGFNFEKDGETHRDIILASAPRHRGQVVFYSKPSFPCQPGPRRPCQPRPIGVVLEGPALGSFFGAALASGAITGVKDPKGFRVIVVGAPFRGGGGRGERGGGGAVFLYDQFTMLKNPHRIEGPPGHTGFGAALAIADLDDDQFDDILVGAPFFESDVGGVTGAVFVFRGRSDVKMIKTPSQFIAASEVVGGKLDKFGHAIAAGQDLNGDGFSDVVVGCYASDAVAAFFSRPVVAVRGALVYEGDGIKVGDDSFALDVCFEKGRSGVAGVVKLSFVVDESAPSPGGRKTRTPPKKTSTGHLIRGELDFAFDVDPESKCVRGTQIFLDDRVPSYEDVHLHLDFWQVEDEDGRGGGAKRLRPIIDPDVVGHALVVPFDTECSGINKLCLNDLRIRILDVPSSSSSPSSSSRRLFLGLRKTFLLDILVRNSGPDPAHRVRLNVTRPPEVGVDVVVGKTPWTASLSSSLARTFKVVDVLLPGEEVKLRTEIVFEEFDEKRKRIQMEFGAFCDIKNSLDESSADAVSVFSVVVDKSTDVRLFGDDLKDQEIFEPHRQGFQVEHLEDVGPEVVHRYTVVNDGPTGIPGVLLKIHWPSLIEYSGETTPLLYLHASPLVDGVETGVCRVGGDGVNPRRLTPRPLESRDAEILRRNAEGDGEVDDFETLPPRARRSMDRSLRLLSNASLSSSVLDCDASAGPATTPRVRCVTINCHLPGMERDSTNVEIRSRLWIDSIVQLFPDQELSMIKSHGYAVMYSKMAADVYKERNFTNNKATAITFAYKSFQAEPKKIPLWVIAVSTVGGVLLLLLLVLILWRLNFFKRRRPEMEPRYKAVKTREATADPEEAELETLNWNLAR